MSVSVCLCVGVGVVGGGGDNMVVYNDVPVTMVRPPQLLDLSLRFKQSTEKKEN